MRDSNDVGDAEGGAPSGSRRSAHLAAPLPEELRDDLPDDEPDFLTEDPYGAWKTADGEDPHTPWREPTEAELTRRELLKHESSVRGAGLFTMAFGVLLLVRAVFGLASLFGPGALEHFPRRLPWLAFATLMGAACFYIGRGVRRLDPGMETAASLLYGSWILYGLISLFTPAKQVLLLGLAPFFLWLMHGEKGRRVISREYHRTVAATPRIRSRIPLWLWVIAILYVISLILLWWLWNNLPESLLREMGRSGGSWPPR